MPNVVGAGAMGWVLRRPGAAEKLREQHQAMVRAFSEVTVKVPAAIADCANTATHSAVYTAVVLKSFFIVMAPTYLTQTVRHI